MNTIRKIYFNNHKTSPIEVDTLLYFYEIRTLAVLSKVFR